MSSTRPPDASRPGVVEHAAQGLRRVQDQVLVPDQLGLLCAVAPLIEEILNRRREQSPARMTPLRPALRRTRTRAMPRFSLNGANRAEHVPEVPHQEDLAPLRVELVQQLRHVALRQALLREELGLARHRARRRAGTRRRSAAARTRPGRRRGPDPSQRAELLVRQQLGRHARAGPQPPRSGIVHLALDLLREGGRLGQARENVDPVRGRSRLEGEGPVGGHRGMARPAGGSATWSPCARASSRSAAGAPGS